MKFCIKYCCKLNLQLLCSFIFISYVMFSIVHPFAVECQMYVRDGVTKYRTARTAHTALLLDASGG